MIEVFIPDISSKIKSETADLKINIDFNETDLSFPCGHKILRVEGDVTNSDKTVATVNQLGLKTEVLEDKICK